MQLALIAALSLLITGGAAWLAMRPATRAIPDADPGREIVDMTSRPVRIPRDPARVLSLCTSATDTMVALGQTTRLAAIDEYSAVVPGAEKVTVIGKGSAISREHVQALRIDLAFVWWYQDDAADMLAHLSVPVVRIRSGRATEVPAMIRLVGDCLGCSDAASRLAEPVASSVQSPPPASQPANRPSVYLELYSPFKTVGRDGYMDDLIELAGGTNIAHDATGSVLLSAERLIQADPDVILCVSEFASPQDMARRPGLADLRAVKSGRVHAIDRRWLVAGRSLPEAVARLRGIIRGEPPRPEE